MLFEELTDGGIFIAAEMVVILIYPLTLNGMTVIIVLLMLHPVSQYRKPCEGHNT